MSDQVQIGCILKTNVEEYLICDESHTCHQRLSYKDECIVNIYI